MFKFSRQLISLYNRITYNFNQLIRYKPLVRTNKFSSFSKEDLMKISLNNSMSLNEKIMIYSTLKNKYQQSQKYLQNNILYNLTLEQQVSPFLGLFLQAYKQLNIRCLKYYIDYYSNIDVPAEQEFDINKYISSIEIHKIKDEVDSWIVSNAKNKNRSNLIKLFFASSLNFDQFIEFMRLFLKQIKPEIFQSYINEMYQQPKNNEDKILLLYMCKLLNIQFTKYSILEQNNTTPLATRDPKSICILFELLSQTHPQTLPKLIDSLQFDKRWNYDNIIWISEFIGNNKLNEAHQRLLQTTITDISTLSLYTKRISKYQQIQISDWLCNQLKQGDLLQEWKSQLLLQLIDNLPKQQYFNQYILLLAKQCKGRLNWQQTTRLYYNCKLKGLQNDDVDALRIYVVNGYTSMGTSRTRIPTSSFYYKLIEIVPAKQLFKYEIPF